MNVVNLPNDMLLIIFQYLNLKDLLNLKLVNKHFCEFVKNNEWNVKIKFNKYVDRKNIDNFLENHKFVNIMFENYYNMTDTAKYLVNCKKIILKNSDISSYFIDCLYNCNTIVFIEYLISDDIRYLKKCHNLKFKLINKTFDILDADSINNMDLESIGFIGCYLSQEFVDNLKLPGLKYLKINTTIYGSMNILLSNLPNLEKLYITNRIDDDSLEIICNNMKKLKYLLIYNFSGSNLKYLHNLKNLEHLTISKNEDYECFSDLSGLKNLKYLKIDAYKFNINSYIYLENVKYLVLNDFENENEYIEYFKCPKLEHVKLQYITITDKIITYLNKLNLSYLNITRCEISKQNLGKLNEINYFS